MDGTDEVRNHLRGRGKQRFDLEKGSLSHQSHRNAKNKRTELSSTACNPALRFRWHRRGRTHGRNQQSSEDLGL
jgi:hypothetical protein